MAAESNTFTCPHNVEVDCDSAKCKKCGWYPPVEQKRKEAILKQKLYRVPFTGYCEVWASSPEEAAEKADDVPQQFFAHYDFTDPICLSKEENDELD